MQSLTRSSSPLVLNEELSMSLARKTTLSSFSTAETILAICLLFVTLHSANAQVLQGGVNFLVGLPQGAFKENVNRAGVGITGNIGLAPKGYAYMFGLELGYMNYGTESRREPFSTTIPDVTVDVSTENNFASGRLLFRLQPNNGFIRPYLEGAIGGNYLFTRTTIKNQGNGGEEVASSTNLDDFAFSYGGGGGVLVLLFTKEDKEQEPGKVELGEVLLDLRCTYMAGSQAEYLKEGSIRRFGGRVVYDVSKSQTDLLMIQLGVAFRF
jgi:hypothetical protein